MNYEEFKKILKNNKLNVKKFSELANISYNTCNAWSKRGVVSGWVETWLNLYIENKQLRESKDNTDYTAVADAMQNVAKLMSDVAKNKNNKP